MGIRACSLVKTLLPSKSPFLTALAALCFIRAFLGLWCLATMEPNGIDRRRTRDAYRVQSPFNHFIRTESHENGHWFVPKTRVSHRLTAVICRLLLPQRETSQKSLNKLWFEIRKDDSIPPSG